MDVKKIYNQLTNVDIAKQKQLWDERGKGYYGEYLVFTDLYKNIQGNCKILMNLNIPTEKNKTTEIDLLMIHETGIYVFEIKHYKGTIYGKDTDDIWTQYFRTTKNSHFKNPVLQNAYHINAISKLYPNIPIKSVIVFTNNESTIKVTQENKNTDICTLNNLYISLERRFNESLKSYSLEEIDNIFNELSKYSQIQEPIKLETEEKTFYQWIQPIINKLEKNKLELEEEKINYTNKSKQLNRLKLIEVIIFIFITMLCILISNVFINNNKENYEKELSKFKQNFLHVDQIDNEYITKINNYVEISNVYLNYVTNEITSFSATLSINNDSYGIALTEESKYIVMTNSNKIYEYDIFGKHLFYVRFNNIISKNIRNSGTLKEAQFAGIHKDEITYIKITNIDLLDAKNNNSTIKSNLELELYKK